MRVGVLIDGALVEERLVRKTDAVTIGQSTRNTLVLPVDGAPEAWTLIRRVKGRLVLSTCEGMESRLSAGGAVTAFTGARTAPIDRGARGKVTLGAATVLFQLVEVPVQPRPTLPKSVRGTLADRVNPALAAIVAVSVTVHGALAYWLYQRDVRSPSQLQRLSERAERQARPADYRTIVVPADLVPDPVRAPGVDVKIAGDPATPQTDRPRAEPSRVVRTGPDSPRTLDDAAIRELVDNSTAIAVLTGGPDSSSRYGRMTGKDPGGDLDRALEHAAISGDPIVTNRPDGLIARDDRDLDIARSDGPEVDGPRAVAVADPKAEDRLPEPKIREVEPFDPDGVDPATIATRIRRRYLKGIQKCHAGLLRVEPTAGGRLDLELTVNRVGQTISATARGIDPTLEACVEDLATRWRFPVAKADGEPIEATYATVFQLRPPS